MTSQIITLSASKIGNGFIMCRKFLIIVAVLLLTGSPLYAQTAGKMTPEQLVPLMQKGGLILYVRHAATDHSQSDTDLSDFSKCNLQRNLSEQGKRESKHMADAIRTLKIPVGDVFTSPYCRCIDTAEIVFGRYKIANKMQATFYTDKAQTAELASFLKAQLSTMPKTGMNTVLVGHTANLREVTKVWPKPEGVTHVFEPLGTGKYRHLGRILPTEWQPLANKN